MTATASATASAVPQDWLTVDDSAAQRGFGPAEFGDPQESPPVATVPTAPSPLPLAPPAGASDSGGPAYDGDGSGAWPWLPQSGDGRTWLERGDGFPQGLHETQAPHTNAPGMWDDGLPLQTYDHLSQHTDMSGWDQTVPNDRVSARRTFGQANPDNNPTWYPYSENAVTSHLAIGAVPYTTDEYAAGTPGFGAGGLPDWAMTGGQGNTAYETPAPPPVSAVVPSYAADPAAGWF